MIFEPIIAQVVAQNCVKIVAKKAPLILMSIGIGGMGASTVMAVKATPKASAIYKQITRDPELSPRERNKAILERVVPLYAPAAITAVGGATCIVGSYSINMARLAELGALYAVAQNNLTTYRKQVEDIYGREEELRIANLTKKREEERVSEAEQVDEFAKHTNKPMLPATGGANQKLFYDLNTNRPVWSTKDEIYDACMYIQHRLDTGEMFIAYSEFETELGLKPGKFAEDKGWVAGDIVRPCFSKDEYVTDDGHKYREFEIDTNPGFTEEQKLGDIM